jgi:hypothetical protein
VIHSNRVGASVILKNPRPFTVDIFYRIPVELKRRVLFVKNRESSVWCALANNFSTKNDEFLIFKTSSHLRQILFKAILGGE